MYYKKSKSFIRSIKNNNNNKTYYVLIVLMLAAIGIIAASIILRGHDNRHDAGIKDELITTTEYAETENNSEGYASSGRYAIYILVDDGITAVCRMDDSGNVDEIIDAARCYIGDNVKAYAQQRSETVLSGLSVVPTKAIWKETAGTDDTEAGSYYVQYYSMINGIEFHSALYSENGNYNSIVEQSYNMISGYENSDESGNDTDIAQSADGITMSVASAHWFYENVPGTTDIYVCESLEKSSLGTSLADKSVSASDMINSALSDSADGKYMQNGILPQIPHGFHCDPTDEEANYIFSPYRLGAINNVSDKNVEMGQIAYSFIDNESPLVHIIFNDVTLTSEDGTDISEYLVAGADVSMYVDAQIAAMNVNGFLLPGDYVVRFSAADIYGTVLERSCYLHVVDATAPVISLSREITEINRAQIENPDYIRDMVTVTELCKLTDEGLTYSLTEDGDNVHITFSASDVYGNVGTLDIDLKRVD